MDETSQTLCIARQPICDARGHLLAYELLFRSLSASTAAVQDRDLATTDVLVTGFLELGLDTLVRDRPVHVNLSPAFLEGSLEVPDVPERLVLELPRDAAATQARLDGATTLARAGFELVLDDFRYGLELEPLLEIARAVKLDVADLPAGSFREQAAVARVSGLRVIAKGVEVPAAFHQARELGCSGYQGFYFAVPELLRSRPLPANQPVLLELLARLQDPDLPMNTLERLLAQEATLAYRLLRYANSAALSLGRSVETVREAAVLLGVRLVRQWATLLVLARFGEARPEPLLDSALLRGRMCELLAVEQGLASADAGFTTGLFSTLDALMGAPLEELLDQISLEPTVRRALLGEGALGATLRQAIAYEQGRWGEIPAEALERFKSAYEDALRWCDETRALLQAP